MRDSNKKHLPGLEGLVASLYMEAAAERERIEEQKRQFRERHAIWQRDAQQRLQRFYDDWRCDWERVNRVRR